MKVVAILLACFVAATVAYPAPVRKVHKRSNEMTETDANEMLAELEQGTVHANQAAEEGETMDLYENDHVSEILDNLDTYGEVKVASDTNAAQETMLKVTVEHDEDEDTVENYINDEELNAASYVESNELSDENFEDQETGEPGPPGELTPEEKQRILTGEEKKKTALEQLIDGEIDILPEDKKAAMGEAPGTPSGEQTEGNTAEMEYGNYNDDSYLTTLSELEYARMEKAGAGGDDEELAHASEKMTSEVRSADSAAAASAPILDDDSEELQLLANLDSYALDMDANKETAKVEVVEEAVQKKSPKPAVDASVLEELQELAGTQ